MNPNAMYRDMVLDGHRRAIEKVILKGLSLWRNLVSRLAFLEVRSWDDESGRMHRSSAVGMAISGAHNRNLT